MPARYDIRKKGALFAGDVVLIVLSVHLSVLLRLTAEIKVLEAYTGAILFFAAIYPLSFYIFDLYDLCCKVRSLKYFSKLVISVAAGTSLLAALHYYFPSWKFGGGVFLINMITVLILAYSWRLLFSSRWLIHRKPKTIAIVGTGEPAVTIYEELCKATGFRIKGFLDDEPEKTYKKIGCHRVLGNTALLTDMALRHEIDSAVIAVERGDGSGLLKALIKSKMLGVQILDMPNLYERLTGKIPIMHLTEDSLAYANFRGLERNVYTGRLKGLLDAVLAAAGLVLTLPIAIITAVAIKLDSKGPVLYRQKRIGCGGRVFELLKFRSMVENAEPVEAVWAEENDPRVTRVGRLIRRTRIDEIPQMWNVLKGEMSLIGPRPERPEFVRRLENEIPFYSMRHAVKPGITGWAQVNYRYGASTRDALEKLQYDLFYIKNLSPLIDLHILLRTMRVVLFGTGAR